MCDVRLVLPHEGDSSHTFSSLKIEVRKEFDKCGTQKVTHVEQFGGGEPAKAGLAISIVPGIEPASEGCVFYGQIFLFSQVSNAIADFYVERLIHGGELEPTFVQSMWVILLLSHVPCFSRRSYNSHSLHSISRRDHCAQQVVSFSRIAVSRSSSAAILHLEEEVSKHDCANFSASCLAPSRSLLP